MANDDTERYYAKNRAEWRAWLEANHTTEDGVWLIYYKKESGKPRVDYDEAVEEALCFGWIDSRPNKIDDESYMQLFSPRKAKSPWSRLNKERIKRLIEQGLMTPAGMTKIEAAKRDGSWTIYDEIEDIVIPDDLAAALMDNEAARVNFEAFGDSYKKGILWWIKTAKRPETRAKRVKETVELAAQNIRAQFNR